MSKTLLIRQLSGDSQDALEIYKDTHGVKTNTEAAMAMMSNYHRIANELKYAKSRFVNLKNEIDIIKDCYRDYLKYKARFEALLSDDTEE